ncbi:hypothetical protein Sfulv_56330 [Streptomyces fulvorobeus]|uniref:Alkanesulfonate monooxygenase n=1 Tax=Streptomyces fulvorobeus TaxID=284028 RepID=A0A7J0CE89_9ACTN|nr:hypothetical protein Sfulv_56330 [Streptomyces fulvorobeus]
MAAARAVEAATDDLTDNTAAEASLAVAAAKVHCATATATAAVEVAGALFEVAGTALVGSHHEVAERIAEYHRLGIDEFILSGHPHVEEAYWVGEGVLPCWPTPVCGPTPPRSPGSPTPRCPSPQGCPGDVLTRDGLWARSVNVKPRPYA